jgi:tripartite-type tricarboxylate transporter receptor subunit TctC
MASVAPQTAAVRVLVLLAGVLAAFGEIAFAQNYPLKTVRVVVPVAPGGGVDTQTRLLAKKFQENMGQIFTVDNRTGAASMIGTEIVVKSPPDGYTLLAAAASIASAVTLNKNLPFDIQRDLIPVSQISSAPQLLLVHPSLPAKSLNDLIALARKQPGRLNAASGGTGSANHLAIEMLKQRAGIDVTHVPYKGAGPTMVALMSGEVAFAFAGTMSALPHIRTGRMRALAVTTPKHSPAVPDAPPLAAVFPGFESTNWYGFFAPAGTPAAIVTKVSSEVAAGIKAPEVREFLMKEGADPVGSTPQQFAAFFRGEVERYARVIKTANIKIE